MSYCNRDKYRRVYEWNGGTLVLDPGVFTFDEPHVYMHKDPPGYATHIDCMYRGDLQKKCESPARVLAISHHDAPASVKAKCDTMLFDEGYCCPPYAMPRNWRTDFISMGQEEEVPVINDQTEIFDDASLYAADARLVAGKMQLESEPVLEEFDANAQYVYDYIAKELTLTAAQIEQTATDVAQQAAKQVVPATTEAVETTRTGIRKYPLLSLGLGVLGGLILARWVSSRRR